MIARIFSLASRLNRQSILQLHAHQRRQRAHRPVPVAVVERYAVPVADLLVYSGHSIEFDNDFVAEVGDVVEDGLVKGYWSELPRLLEVCLLLFLQANQSTR